MDTDAQSLLQVGFVVVIIFSRRGIMNEKKHCLKSYRGLILSYMTSSV